MAVGDGSVFVRTKRGADRLVKRLGSQDVRALAMNGNKSQNQRERVLSKFDRGNVGRVVLQGRRGPWHRRRGDLPYVINFDAPEDHEGDAHRVGGTGRALAQPASGGLSCCVEQAHYVGKIAKALSLD